jgi:excinuclease UvrABC nuclease subunit
MIYDNINSENPLFLSGLKGKAGIYMWTHKESGKRYIGSSFDLSKRLSNYLSIFYLNRSN